MFNYKTTNNLNVVYYLLSGIIFNNQLLYIYNFYIYTSRYVLYIIVWGFPSRRISRQADIQLWNRYIVA